MAHQAEHQPIDKLHIAALKKADTVAFFDRGAKPVIQATKHHKRTVADPFASEWTTIDIPCRSNASYWANDGFLENAVELANCQAAITSCQFHQSWMTIVDLLRPGDLLTLVWKGGSWSSDALRKAGLDADYLELRVTRGAKVMTFFVDHYIGPADAAWRMVRYNDPQWSLAEAARQQREAA